MSGPPLWLLCELTYTCPLHCVFCYNPIDFANSGQELSTAEWLRVLREGRELAETERGGGAKRRRPRPHDQVHPLPRGDDVRAVPLPAQVHHRAARDV